MTDNQALAAWRAGTSRQITADGDDGHVVRMSRRYAAPVADVWDAWTDPERASRWLGAVSGDLRAGGEALLVMTEDIKVPCRITVCDPPHRLAVTWRHPGEPESAAEIRLRADGDGTILELEHARLRAADAVGYGYGWEDFLDRLAALLAGGDPGAVSWEESQRVLRPRWEQAQASGGTAG
jgi:uncharacterized protein YndB with AHSA1/START domain